MDFQAIDSKPVRLVILLASPPDKTSDHIQALARLFPVLHQVPQIPAHDQDEDIPDPQELRRRAFGALRELLRRLPAAGIPAGIPLVLAGDINEEPGGPAWTALATATTS